MSHECSESSEVTVSPHPSRKQRLVILIDHQPWREVDLYFFQNHRGILEKCKTEEELQQAFAPIELQQARAYALRRVAKHSLPKKSLVRSLMNRAVSQDTIQQVIADFETRGYINDTEWAQSFVRQQQAKKYGARAIAQKLAAKGISGGVTLSAEQIEESIQALLTSKYSRRDLTDYKERAKVVGALLRRGFEIDDIQRVMRALGDLSHLN